MSNKIRNGFNEGLSRPSKIDGPTSNEYLPPSWPCVKEWADHLLFVGYDVDVQDGKGRGAGTRTIYPTERPHCMAKSRTLAEPVVYERHDAALWNQLLGHNA